MMFWFQLAVVVLLLIAVGWIAVGGGGHMSPPVPDRPDPAVPDTGLLGRGDVDKVRFSVGARGYRMDEVDDVLDRLAHEIDLREQRIAQLEGRPVAAGASGEDPGPVSAEQLPALPQRQQTAQAQEGHEAQEAQEGLGAQPERSAAEPSSITEHASVEQPGEDPAEQPGPSDEA